MKILEQFPVLYEVDKSNRLEAEISALHSGNIGDIIYALPTCYLLHINHIILNLCQDPAFGGRVMTLSSAKALAPLLIAQTGITKVSIINTGVPWEFAQPENIGVNYVLDSFRNYSSAPDLHLAFQHAIPFGLHVDASQPWLNMPLYSLRKPIKDDYLVIGLTARYRRYCRTYYEDLFKGLPAERLYFVGLEEDQAQRAGIPGRYFRTENFLELATLIKNAKFFIGNASFPYALAESLKVPRFVEAFPNAYPLGENGYSLHLLPQNEVRQKLWQSLGIANSIIEELEEAGKAKDSEISRLHNQINELKTVQTQLLNSTSWRITKPLRMIRQRLRDT